MNPATPGLPSYGVFRVGDGEPRSGVTTPSGVVDLYEVTGDERHRTGSLNAFLAGGPALWATVAEEVDAWCTARPGTAHATYDAITSLLPFEVADYVDFYSSRDHAENAARVLRPGDEPLTPNWLHLPIGYHGRAGTVRVSGTPVVRPRGQILDGSGVPTFGPTAKLDLEAEVGYVVGVPSDGPVPVERVADHVFGVCVVNDWSARDVQAWEYRPLGPFLGKSFQTGVSPWVVPLSALQGVRVPAPQREVPVLPYLDDTGHPWGLDLVLEVSVDGHVLSRPPYAGTYWTVAQQIAHLTVNGATLRTGDLIASGTVSGPRPDQWGSLLELTHGGTAPLVLPDGTSLGYLRDGDEVTVSAAVRLDGALVPLGAVTGTVLPAS